jgi:hypothetical protein
VGVEEDAGAGRSGEEGESEEKQKCAHAE